MNLDRSLSLTVNIILSHDLASNLFIDLLPLYLIRSSRILIYRTLGVSEIQVLLYHIYIYIYLDSGTPKSRRFLTHPPLPLIGPDVPDNPLISLYRTFYLFSERRRLPLLRLGIYVLTTSTHATVYGLPISRTHSHPAKSQMIPTRVVNTWI